MRWSSCGRPTPAAVHRACPITATRNAGPGVSRLGTAGDQRQRRVRVPDDPAWRHHCPTGGRRRLHINVCLFARGLLRHIFTRLYFAGDPMLADDPVLALVPESRRATLRRAPG